MEGVREVEINGESGVEHQQGEDGRGEEDAGAMPWRKRGMKHKEQKRSAVV